MNKSKCFSHKIKVLDHLHFVKLLMPLLTQQRRIFALRIRIIFCQVSLLSCHFSEDWNDYCPCRINLLLMINDKSQRKEENIIRSLGSRPVGSLRLVSPPECDRSSVAARLIQITRARLRECADLFCFYFWLSTWLDVSCQELFSHESFLSLYGEPWFS